MQARKQTRLLVFAVILNLSFSNLIFGNHSPADQQSPNKELKNVSPKSGEDSGKKELKSVKKSEEVKPPDTGAKELKSIKEKDGAQPGNSGVKELRSVQLKLPSAEDFAKVQYKVKALDVVDPSLVARANTNPLPNAGDDRNRIIPTGAAKVKPSYPSNPGSSNNVRRTKPTPPIPSRETLVFEADHGSDYPDMVALPGGRFQMGSTDGPADESPVHTITISPFEMSKFEITNYQFSLFIKATNYVTQAQRDKLSSWQAFAKPTRGKYPVVMVSWEDANAYCEWLSKVTGNKYRLPTEAEWEFAAQGGQSSDVEKNNDYLNLSLANFAPDITRLADTGENLQFLRAVGSFQPNRFDLYDMVGNVAEWCSDYYDESYYQDSEELDPAGPDSGLFVFRITRGGGWSDPALYCRTTFRNAATIDYKSNSIGFRVVKTK